MEKLSMGLSGIAGEYFVAGELSRRGFMASVTLRNNDSIDIHASKTRDNKMFAIQVKTSQVSKRSWQLNKKAELFEGNNIFYIFVTLKGLEERPDYFIVPSSVIAKFTRDGHAKWLETPGKKGQPHNDTNMRIFFDKEGQYLEKWELLK